MIRIYTKNNCVACKMTKNWLKNNGIDYYEKNIEEDSPAYNYLMINNFRTLPVVFNDGELIAMGFQPQKLKELVK